MHQKKEGSPTPSAAAGLNPTKRSKLTPEKAAKMLQDAYDRAKGDDHVAILSIDAALGKIMHELAPLAKEKAVANDYTLLRLLLKYSQQSNRRLNAERRAHTAQPPKP